MLKHGKVLSSLQCPAGLDSLTAFSSDLVEFGDGADDSRSHTPLLKLDGYTNQIERLYPIPKSTYP